MKRWLDLLVEVVSVLLTVLGLTVLLVFLIIMTAVVGTLYR